LSMPSGQTPSCTGSRRRSGAPPSRRCRAKGLRSSIVRSFKRWSCSKRTPLRIERLRIDAFGQFQRLERELGPELNLFYGPNEAGKSTLLAFVRAILFGFSRRGAPDRYEPEGRTLCGELLLNTHSGTFWVRRAGSRRFQGELQLRTEDG